MFEKLPGLGTHPLGKSESVSTREVPLRKSESEALFLGAAELSQLVCEIPEAQISKGNSFDC